MEKVKAFWDSLDGDMVVNKRELFLGVVACALAGVVVGTFLSPRITMTIGNNNAYGCDDSQSEEETVEEAAEE